MKVLIQRVEEARLSVKEGELKFIGGIQRGLLVFVGIESEDTATKFYSLADKILNLRIFDDARGKLNYSLKDENLEIMLVPNFTLCASLNKGLRPSFERAAPFQEAKESFSLLVKIFKDRGIKCVEGIFGAQMIIEAKNYGPVNIVLEI